MSAIRSSERSDMLPIRLDDVFSSSRTANDKAAVVWLNENIPLPSPLEIVYDFANRPPLSRSQSGVFASCDA